MCQWKECACYIGHIPLGIRDAHLKWFIRVCTTATFSSADGIVSIFRTAMFTSRRNRRPPSNKEVKSKLKTIKWMRTVRMWVTAMIHLFQRLNCLMNLLRSSVTINTLNGFESEFINWFDVSANMNRIVTKPFKSKVKSVNPSGAVDPLSKFKTDCLKWQMSRLISLWRLWLIKESFYEPN